MSTEQTTRPVVDVLREHVQDHRPGGSFYTHCRCGWSGSSVGFGLHQADALAAEGYPVTAEGLADGLAAAALSLGESTSWSFEQALQIITALDSLRRSPTPNPYRQEKTHG